MLKIYQEHNLTCNRDNFFICLIYMKFATKRIITHILFSSLMSDLSLTNLRYLFYLVTPNETTFETIDQVPDYTKLVSSRILTVIDDSNDFWLSNWYFGNSYFWSMTIKKLMTLSTEDSQTWWLFENATFNFDES